MWFASPSSGCTLVPDCGGPIERIAVSLTPRVLAPDDPLHGPLGRFIRTLSPGCTLVAVTERRDGTRAERWLADLMAECRLQVAAVVPDGAFARVPAAEWIQDRFLCGFESGEGRYWDADECRPTIAACLGSAERTQVKRSPVPLAGGNCLVGADFWLIGCDSLRPMADAAAVSRIRRLHDAPLHVVGYDADPAARPAPAPGSLRQPWFHLDLMVSVTGLRGQGGPHLLVADPCAPASPINREAKAQGVRLDAVAARLAAAGFHVSRNPAAFAPGPVTGSGRPRGYNNVLIENWPKQRVWLPQFGDAEPSMRALDRANLDLWEAIGFEVIPLLGWGAATGFQGAVRCASKVLARGTRILATATGRC